MIQMPRVVLVGDAQIRYTLCVKQVKNINLRVVRGGTVHVSANASVPLETIDAFVIRKGEAVLAAIARMTAVKALDGFTPSDDELELDALCGDVFARALARMHPPFLGLGVPMPALRLRRMKTLWGSCLPGKGIITLNKRLISAPAACLDYVVTHELCHLIHPNHSKQFYALLTQMMPDWRARKATLDRFGTQSEC